MEKQLDSSVDWYIDHNVSPVRLNIKDQSIHLLNRKALLWHLGILPSLAKGKSIIEFGPGSGFNALATFKILKPKQYTLVDGNEKGLHEMAQLFSDNFGTREEIRIEQSRILDFDVQTNYDICILENVVAGQLTGREILCHASLFAPIFLFSLVDPVGMFSETLRFYLAQPIIETCNTMKEKVDRLMPIFSPHLATVRGMNRRFDDWIIDNLINPATLGDLLSLPDAIEAIGDQFEFYNSSPRMFSDWQWYKTIGLEGIRRNELVLQQYYENLHNLIDSRVPIVKTGPSVKSNIALRDLCQDFRRLVRERPEKPYHNKEEVTDTLNRIETLCSFSPGTKEAINFGIRFIQERETIESLSKNINFASFFGRSTHVFSFVRS